MTIGYEGMPTDEELLAQAREEGESDGQELLWDVENMKEHPIDNFASSITLLWDNFETAYAALEVADRAELDAEKLVDDVVDKKAAGFKPGEAHKVLREAKYRVRQCENRIAHLSRQGLILSMVRLGKR